MLAFCPGLGYAQSETVQSDLNDTVYLQSAFSDLSKGNALGQQPKTVYGSPGYNRMMGDFESYQDSMNMVLDAQADTTRQRAEFKQLLDTANRAAKANDAGEQNHLFGNYLYDSRSFLIRYPGYPGSTHLWVLRAVAALKLNKPATGFEAGQVLSALPPTDRNDPHIQKILAVLDSVGWLGKGKATQAKPNPKPPTAVTPAKP